jgi:hypothetical protein
MFIVGNQSVNLFMNVVEIGDVFTKPLGISPIYQGNQTILDVYDRLGKLRQISIGFSFVKPILVLAPLTFKEADALSV